ncbi:hypothetical protein FB471_1263 [Amycolatopsis cihanbeyliensis]|uniref:Uncharacterized protein n=1 Tax=Amycolatopsis cihanbeyliensis TaxID=1128664 RepID=A0A542DEU4_AMYCI|nr:hypothetical protein FB471_1263 [Amycolatopsis cihanbeyliensis]
MAALRVALRQSPVVMCAPRGEHHLGRRLHSR